MMALVLKRDYCFKDLLLTYLLCPWQQIRNFWCADVWLSFVGFALIPNWEISFKGALNLMTKSSIFVNL